MYIINIQSVAFKQWLIVTGAKKTFPTWLHYLHQSALLTLGNLGPLIHAVVAKFWPYYLCASAEIVIPQTRLCFSSLQLSNFSEHVILRVSVVFLTAWISLICLINKGFFLVAPFWVNSRDYYGNISSYRNTQTSLSGTNSHSNKSKLLRSYFLYIWCKYYLTTKAAGLYLHDCIQCSVATWLPD